MESRRIFFLPLDLKVGPSTRITPRFIRDSKKIANDLPPEIERKKNSIFTSELNSLIQKVSTSNKAKPVQDVSIPISQTTSVQKFYLEQNNKEEFLVYIKEIFSKKQIDSFSILYLDYPTQTYHNLININLDADTEFNLYFHKKDPYLASSKPISIYFHEIEKDDRFFIKKFSEEIFKKRTGISIIPLKLFDLDLLICIFFTHPFEIKNLDSFSTEIISDLVPILPKINLLSKENSKNILEGNDILKIIIRKIKEAEIDLHSPFYFHLIKLKNYTSLDKPIETKRALLSILEKYISPLDKLIHLNFNQILVISKTEWNSEIFTYLNSNLSQKIEFEIISKLYPEHGKNFFVYF
jgi:hypothetical protein